MIKTLRYVVMAVRSVIYTYLSQSYIVTNMSDDADKLEIRATSVREAMAVSGSVAVKRGWRSWKVEMV